MKAIVHERFGPPDVLQWTDIEVPQVGPGDVLLRVRAASLNPYDWHLLRGDPLVARLMGVGIGVFRPATRLTGVDVAGTVEAVGADVRTLRPGDEVFGFCRGSCAEYAVAAAGTLAPKPTGTTFEEAAALPMGATTALRAVRDIGRVRAGDRVLVNGAAGGVGTAAVQIAADLGAEVTGVCSTDNVDLVRSLGAAHVVDYRREELTAGHVRHDVLLDNVGNVPLARLRAMVTSRGTLVLNGGGSPGRVIGGVGTTVRALALNGFVRQRLRIIPPRMAGSDVRDVAGLVEAGLLRPVVERTYPLSDTAEALRHVERGHTRGKVVITVS